MVEIKMVDPCRHGRFEIKMVVRKTAARVYITTFRRFAFYGGGKMNFKLFDLDLKTISNPQLADWLYTCRNDLKRENFDSDVQYYSAITEFCKARKQHYKKNIEFYEVQNSIFY